MKPPTPTPRSWSGLAGRGQVQGADPGGVRAARQGRQGRAAAPRGPVHLADLRVAQATRPRRAAGAGHAGGTPAGRSPRPRGRPATQAEPAPGRRARQGPQGDRGPGKALGAVGAVRHRQRPGDRGRDEVTDQAVAELTPLVGVRAGCQAVGEAQARWYRRHRQGPPPPKPKRAPAAQPRALSEVERTQLRRVLNSPEHVDEAPATVYAKLLDQGVYLGSVPTMYRVLRAHDEVRERRRQATHPAAKKPELLATKPNQVYSWDITKLLGPAKWTYYYLYVLLDIFSRYVPGWMLAHAENARLAEALLAEVAAKQGIAHGQLTVHADRGSPMTAKPVAFLLANLGVTKSHSRPHCSNDCDDAAATGSGA